MIVQALDWEKHLKISLLTVKMGWPGEQKNTKKKSRACEIHWQISGCDWCTHFNFRPFSLSLFFSTEWSKKKDLLLLCVQYFLLWKKDLSRFPFVSGVSPEFFLKHIQVAWQTFMNKIMNSHSCGLVVSYAFCQCLQSFNALNVEW